MVYVLMALVLLWRPKGLFGQRTWPLFARQSAGSIDGADPAGAGGPAAAHTGVRPALSLSITARAS
jgi:hypothetical protein